MRRVLIDECLPVQLHRWLDQLDVRTVEFMGWKGKRNSELLAAAKGKFDVLVTSDSLLLQGQELATIGLGLVIVGTNRVAEVERLVPQIAAATMRVGNGERVMVPVAGPKSAQ